MITMSTKVRLSHSGSNTYATCSWKYKLHYNDRIRPTYAYSFLPFGSAIDNTLNYILESYRDGKDFSDYLDKFETCWSTFENNGHKYELFNSPDVIRYLNSDMLEEELTEEEFLLPEHQRYWLSLNRKGKQMLTNYVTNFLPKVKKVIAVQKEVTVPSSDGSSLYGIIDFVAELEGTDGPVICDNKTSSSKYPKKSVSVSPQLSTYSFALGGITKGAYVVLLKKAPYEVQLVIDDISTELEETTLNNLQEIAHNINENIFDKNWKACHSHFGRKCPYYDYCRNQDMNNLEVVTKERR